MRRSTDYLTDRRVRSLKAQEQQYEVTDGGSPSSVPGLALRVFSSGSKSWFLRYGPREARKRIVLGTYPSLSLEDARNKARELVAGVNIVGRDPMAEKKAERKARKKALGATFEALAMAYMEEHAKRNKRLRPWKEDERKLRVEVLPVWGSRPAAEILRADVRALLERIAAERGGVCANRTRTLISKVFSFGMERDRVESNPVHGVKRLYVEKPRERVLAEEEARALWPLFDRLQPAVAAAWRLVLLTAQRPGEVLSMRWRDLERDSRGTWWNIPAELTKTNRAHRVPLSPQALAVIEALRRSLGHYGMGARQPRRRQAAHLAVAQLRPPAGVVRPGTLHPARSPPDGCNVARPVRGPPRYHRPTSKPRRRPHHPHLQPGGIRHGEAASGDPARGTCGKCPCG